MFGTYDCLADPTLMEKGMVSSVHPRNPPKMPSSKFLLSILLLLITVASVWGSGCDNTDTQKLLVINLCDEETWTMGRLVFNITTANMGSNTRCSCTLRSKTPGVKTKATYTLWNVESSAHRCEESFIQVTGAGLMSLTCTFPPNVAQNTGEATDEVKFTLGRTDTSVEVSYCLFLQPDGWQAFDKELTCEGNSPTTPHTTTVTTTSMALPTTSLSSTSQRSSLVSSTTSAFMTSSASSPSGVKVSASADVTVSPDNTSSEAFPVGAVVGGVLGAIALIGLTVVASVFIGCRYMARRPSAAEAGADNSAYTSLSDVTRVKPRADPNYSVIQSEGSSSQQAGNDVAAATGVYETVEEVSSAARTDNSVNNTSSDTGTYYNV